MISNAFVPPFCATYPPTRCWAMCGPFQRRIQGCGIIVLFRKRRHENSVWKQLEKIEPSRCRSIRVDTSERPKDLSHIIFPSFALLSYKTVSIKQLQKKLKRYGLNMVGVQCPASYIVLDLLLAIKPPTITESRSQIWWIYGFLLLHNFCLVRWCLHCLRLSSLDYMNILDQCTAAPTLRPMCTPMVPSNHFLRK